MTGSEGVSLRLPQLFLSQQRLIEMEGEKERMRPVNLGITTHMQELNSNTVEKEEVAYIKQSFFRSFRAVIHYCTHSTQYAASRPVY